MRELPSESEVTPALGFMVSEEMLATLPNELSVIFQSFIATRGERVNLVVVSLLERSLVSFQRGHQLRCDQQ